MAHCLNSFTIYFCRAQYTHSAQIFKIYFKNAEDCDLKCLYVLIGMSKWKSVSSYVL